MPAWDWLSSTEEQQNTIYGSDLPRLRYALREGDAGPLAEFINWNLTAAVQELAEVREEFSWKPWATDAPFVNRKRVVEECVDVLHFVGNILAGLGVSDGEFWAEYRRKQYKNRQRQESGTYSAKKGGVAMGSDS